ncbi:MAG: DnaJ domain-containing protein [Spirochaetes bacterium]|nr:DnaJ domain-containing protein [Spirochaetota bacterium]
MNVIEDKQKQYRLIFGLSETFSKDELRSAYATLARLNHPDRNPGADSLAKMVIINEAYSFLKNNYQDNHNSTDEKTEQDPAYTIYKTGFMIMKQAFDEYFGETKPKINAGNRKLLAERLTNAKISFSELVTNFPYNSWTSDAIDKIFSINKWID